MSKKTDKIVPGGSPPNPVHPFRKVRRAGVPLSFFETADPAALLLQCQRALNGSVETVPVIQYDVSASLRSVNKAGEAWIKTGDGQEIVAAAAMGCAAMLQAMANKPPVVPLIGKDGAEVTDESGRTVTVGAIVFLHNWQRLSADFTTVQAAWNCRDAFKGAGVSLVMLGHGSQVPPELRNDVPIFSETVPGEDDIKRIVSSVCEDQGIAPDTFDMPRVVDGCLGYLSAFNVEQSFALSLLPKAEGGGVDYQQLWDLKVASLKATSGLEITLPTVGFDAMAGNEGVKQLLRYELNGRTSPRAVLWLDEIEKMVAGAQAGNLDGGASMAIMEQFLFWTAQRKARGFLLLGIPGAGKSLTAQVTAGEAKCPLLRGSMSTLKGGIVGSTEANMKAFLASVDAIAQGRLIILATCNSLEALSPELMGRFNPVVFYDFPTADEIAAIWKYYLGKFGLQGQTVPRVKNWVGREIELCCERAHNWNITLEQSAETIIPSCVANAAKLDALRRSADGRFSSAAHPGLYQVETTQSTVPAAGRKMNLV